MTEANRWRVLIEEHRADKSIDAFTTDQVFGDRDTAQEAASRMAREHQPQHPAMPRSRTVLRKDADTYAVLVEGMTMTFEFRPSVCEEVAVV